MARVERIGRYEIVAPLAAGGMGEVMLARMRGLGGFERHVVLKTVDLAGDEPDKAKAMFLDEARLLGRLHHQHIAPVFEVNEDAGKLFLVIDYIHGRTAQQVWQQALDTGTQLPFDFALAIVGGAASGLHYAHTRTDEQGRPLHIVHRDVSLSNLMIGYDGAIKLIDFGIAKAADRRVKTETGFVKGKLGYLSPEQLRQGEVDARTDVFALGIVLYELTTMTRPFREPSDRMTTERIKSGAYRKPSELIPSYPPELEAIVVRALRVDPRERFQSADEMRRAIDALGHHYELLVGDAAVVEVMAQLFDERREPWQRMQAPRAQTDLDAPAILDDSDLPPPRPHKKPLRSATELVDALVSELDTAPSRPPGSPSLDSALPTPRPGDVPVGEFDDAAPTAIGGARVATVPVADDEAITADGPARPLDPPEEPLSATERVASIQRLFTSMDPTETPMQPLDALPEPPRLASEGVPVEAPVASPIRISTKRGIVGGNTDGQATVAPPPVHAAPPPPRTSSSAMRIAWIAIALIAIGAIVIALYSVLGNDDDTPEMPVVSAPDTTAVDAAAVDVASPAIDAVAAAGDTASIVDAPAVDASPSGGSGSAGRMLAIKITSTPPGATVVLDGKKLGKTPYEAAVVLTPGPHAIKVRMIGFNTQKLDVGADDQKLEKDLVMVKVKPKPETPGIEGSPGGLDIPD